MSSSSTTIRRLVATASDMDVSGLAVVGYYLRLYAVELILGDAKEHRSEEQTQLATELLNQVEEYKTMVTSSKEEDAAAFTILHEQDKAKVYMMNFALSLYNGKLKQMQDGKWDDTLRRGLWCSLDLFQCLSRLWGMQNEFKDRIKYCKIYLRKIARTKQPMDRIDEKEVNKLSGDLNIELKEGLEKPLVGLQPLGGEPSGEEPSGGEPSRGPEPETEREAPSKKVGESSDVDLRTIMDKSMAIEQIQKKAKFAVSALNYEDLETAKQELVSALTLLKGLEGSQSG